MCLTGLLLREFDQISLYFILAIMLCFTPVLAYIMWKLSWFGRDKWEQHRNKVDMKFYEPRFEEQRNAGVVDPYAQARRGRYDIRVEDCIRARQIPQARRICEELLADDSLSDDQRDMYERYIRIIDEQLAPALQPAPEEQPAAEEQPGAGESGEPH